MLANYLGDASKQSNTEQQEDWILLLFDKLRQQRLNPVEAQFILIAGLELQQALNLIYWIIAFLDNVHH